MENSRGCGTLLGMRSFLLFLLLLPGLALAQGYRSAGPRAVISTPDGGPLRVGIDDSVRLDVSAATAPGTTLGVSGVDGTDVRVELNANSLATITAATTKGNCTYVESATNLAVGATSGAVPASPMTGRTAVTLTNWSTGKVVHCIPGGTPTATLGKVVSAGGVWWKWEGAGAGWVLNCICISAAGVPTTGCAVQVEEERCYQ